MHDLTSDQLHKINWLLRQCGQKAKDMASANQFQVFEKGVDDYVTTVDRALDLELAAAFSTLFPADGVITEENAHSRQTFHDNHDRLWFIDPIDGTDDFIQGKPHYSLMVGLLQADQPIAGWVYAPAFEQLYYGGTDWGLFQSTGDGAVEPFTPIEPAVPSADFCPMLIGYKDRKQFGEAIANLIPGAEFRCIGSFGLKVMEVVCGRAGLYMYFNRRVKLWDTVGPIALARAAGLVCCDLEGNPFRFSADAVEPETLMHRQFVLIGWPSYVMALRSRVQEAVYSVLDRKAIG